MFDLRHEGEKELVRQMIEHQQALQNDVDRLRLEGKIKDARKAFAGALEKDAVRN